MAYRVKSGSFEGPFDLLLELVSRQKIDVTSISIAEIADQYLTEVSGMELVDLDVASDFLLVAATLLELKAATLLSGPRAREAAAESYDSSVELIERLITYRQFKSAAAALSTKAALQARLHGRVFGPDESFTSVMPDFLEAVTLAGLAERAAALFGRSELALMEAEHIAPEKPPVERYVAALERLVAVRQRLTFHELLDENSTPAIFVVNFLAMLELYKRHVITISQETAFGDITIEAWPQTPAIPGLREEEDL